MSILDIFRISKIKKENEYFSNLINEIGAADVISVKKKVNEYENIFTNLKNNISDLEQKNISLENEISIKNKEIIVLDDEILFESFSLYKPKFAFTNSSEHKEKLSEIRKDQKLMIKNNEAAFGGDNWTINNSKAQGKKLSGDMKKLLLRSFNNESDYCVDNVKFNNIDSFEERIKKSYDTCNKLGIIMDVEISHDYLELKLKELYLAHEYQVKKQEEKEELKRLREEAREQAKLEQEIKEAREKINKERKHFNQAKKDIEKKLENETKEEELNSLRQKLMELEESLNKLNSEEKVIDYRENNAKAGYVYIISNLGSFGSNVFKIGMTRRLEPLDRVDELGDASVPFTFDVHAMIFSENAPDLEKKLHEHFEKSRINKINNRKEFFKADLVEIESIVKNNYNNVVDFIYDAPAEQYRESLKVNN
jgi:hypothetical protein